MKFVLGGRLLTTIVAYVAIIATMQKPLFVDGLIDCNSSDVDVNNSNHSYSVCSYFGGGSEDDSDNEIYIEWYNDQNIQTAYPNHVFLQGGSPNPTNDNNNNNPNGVAVHWSIDDDETYVYLAIAARATGWVGFGLAEAGGMFGADMVIFEARNPDILIDAYTIDERMPFVDGCTPSHWEVIVTSTRSENGFLFFETRRLLNTGDPQDRIIINDSSSLTVPHRVIAAWGDSGRFQYHGLYNRARGSIRFFGTGSNQQIFDMTMDRYAEGSFTIQSINHEIAARETQYYRTCVTHNDMIAQGLPDTDDKIYLIGFEPFVQPGNEAYVHHYVVSGFDAPNCQSTIDDRIPGEMVYAWAPGGHSSAFPETIGFPFNGFRELNSFEIEVHYNNVGRDPDIIDSSGVRFYWTTQPREIEAGIFNAADPLLSLYNDNVGNGITKHTFECSSSCSEEVLDEPITVFREALHMHQTGIHMTNELIRDGEVIHTGIFDYWDFDQNGAGFVIQDTFVVEPGDSFRTSCYYETNGQTRFGVGSQDEMCMVFIMYYPRVKMQLFDGVVELPWVCGHDLPFVDFCSATYEKENLPSAEELDRTFGIPAEECPE